MILQYGSGILRSSSSRTVAKNDLNMPIGDGERFTTFAGTIEDKVL